MSTTPDPFRPEDTPWMFIMPIIAAVKASNGEWYRYPLTLRLVS